MKKLLSIALVVVLLAGIAVSGTMAYLTSEDSDVNVMTLGNVEIDQIELERKEQSDNNVTSANLKEFSQAKPLYPAVGPIKWAKDYQQWATGGSNQLFTADLKNVQDKFVFVENTGKSDAYVRTFVAFEQGSMTEQEFEAAVGQNINGVFWTWETVGYGVKIKDADGVEGTYAIKVATYKGNETVHKDGILPAGDTTRPSLLQVLLYSTATNEDVAKLDGNGNDTYDILVLSQAVQTNGFDDAKTALDTGFGKPEDKNKDGVVNVVAWFENLPSGKVDTWDGTADTTWYNDTDTEFELTSAEQLAGLADLVDGGNTFAGKTIKLGTDIDLYAEDENGERVSFDPIGYGYNVVFKGTFDGQDHTIKNLYQNGWALGLDYSTEGGGLFASVVDATIKNVNIDNAEIVMECIDMGALVGYSYGDCTYENITVSNSTVANYNRYTGGVVGEVNGTQVFKNVDVIDTTVSALWGTYDASLGGIVGGKWGEAKLTFEDCDVACVIDAFNDACSNYQYYNYRLCGMLIGMSEEETDGIATASYLTAKNCTVTYDDWMNYTYCESESYGKGSYAAPDEWKFKRVQEGYATEGVDSNHTHDTDESHEVLLAFDQLFGGDKGVKGGKTHSGVTVKYPN